MIGCERYATSLLAATTATTAAVAISMRRGLTGFVKEWLVVKEGRRSMAIYLHTRLGNEQ